MRKWIGILMAVGFCLCTGCGRTASPEASETETSSVVTTAKVQLDAVQTTAAVQEDAAAAVTTKKKTVDVPNGKKLTAVTPKQTLDTVEKQEITTAETQSTTAIEMVYYSATGSYWHLSEECAKEDYVHVVYNMQGETMPAPKPHITKSPKTMIVGGKTPCPNCAAGE